MTTEDRLIYLYGRCYLNEALTYLLIVQLGPEKVRKMQSLLVDMVKNPSRSTKTSATCKASRITSRV